MVRCLLHSSGNTLCTLDLALSESSDGQPKTWHETCSSVFLRTTGMEGGRDFSALFRRRKIWRSGADLNVRFASPSCVREKVRLIISFPKTARSLGNRTCSCWGHLCDGAQSRGPSRELAPAF